MREVVATYNKLPDTSPDKIDNIFFISPEVREQITGKFFPSSGHKPLNNLANWLVSKEGHNLQYNVNADLTPIQAFNQRVANCLTFSMLLVSLAQHLDIKLDFNEVDTPNFWGINKSNGYVFYRHVNVIRNHHGATQAFDLSMERYDFAYPQRIISKAQAVAKFHSNRALHFLNLDQLPQADHLFKLALSLDQNSADIWANYGVILKHLNKRQRAEQAFLQAISLNSFHVVAASNLERFYQEEGLTQQAEKFRLLAQRSRKRNPYYLFHLAETQLQSEQVKEALKTINKAITIHNKDHKFHHLKGTIYVQLKRPDLAVKSFYLANQLSQKLEDKIRYANEIHYLTSLAE